MGVNKRNRMTNNSASDVPYFIKSTQDFNTVKVVCSRNSTFIMTETNELYQTGEKYGASHDNFTLMKMPKTEVPSKIFCGRKCKFVIDTVGKTFFSGESEEFELPNNTTSASLKEFKLSNDESNTEKIVDIACGHSYNLFVTDKGKLWATGRKFLKRVGLDSEVPINITLPQISQGTPFVMRAWASSAKDE
jgi:alpha-tubulin suppressor-like RCC1 family protein